MCTVIHYRFACGHYATLCKSRCGGTRSKVTRSSRRAACSAKGYITIKRLSLCNKCLTDTWISRWQERLEKARAFHGGLRGLPGAKEVLELIDELEERYELELWELKNSIPYGEKAGVGRVDPVVEKRKLPASPLRLEVRPEDVVLSVVVQPVYDDDDDWVRSTDPLHPILTTYEVFCAGIDDEYLDSLTHGDENDAHLEHEPFDPCAASWGWGSVMAESKPEDWSFHDHTGANPDTHELTGWGPPRTAIPLPVKSAWRGCERLKMFRKQRSKL